MALEADNTSPSSILATSGIRRIELIWPGKDLDLLSRQMPDGRWILERVSTTERLRPLVDVQSFGTDTPQSSLVILGDRVDALRTLSRGFSGAVRLAYLDLPRIELDDKSRAFQGVGDQKWATWLTVVEGHVRAVKPLLRRDGVLILHCGDIEEPYARALVTDRMFAREDQVATIVWQRGYGPRNMKGMKEFTATHDPLLVYAVDKQRLQPVGLRQVPAGYANSDLDPRGPWKAEHKGARTRRANSDFNTYVPPYRWHLVDGRLPKGLWRVSELTGVIWGVPEEVGRFPIRVGVSDADGAIAETAFELRIASTGRSVGPTKIPWAFEEAQGGDDLEIVNSVLPDGVIGQEYSALLLARGGSPIQDRPRRPGSGRYWEFARDTLLRAYLRDEVWLGRDGKAIPHPKAYVSKAGDVEIKNQMTWWPGRAKASPDESFVGYTEDATKHLKKLRELGFIAKETTTAKPEHLLARLMEIFTDVDDVVLEVFGDSADLAATALKLHRRFVHLAGSTDRERVMSAKCGVPRLRAVIEGQDIGLESAPGEIRIRASDYIPYSGGGAFKTAQLGEWFVERDRGEDLPRINRTGYGVGANQRDAILSVEGFIPVSGQSIDGLAWHGKSTALVIDPQEFLTPQLAAEITSELPDGIEKLTVYYYRATDEFDPTLSDGRVAFKRIPVDLGV